MSSSTIENTKTRVKHWHIDASKAREILPNALLAIVGSRATGKTTFLNYLATVCNATVDDRLCLAKERLNEKTRYDEKRHETRNCDALENQNHKQLQFVVFEVPFPVSRQQIPEILSKAKLSLTDNKLSHAVLSTTWWLDIPPQHRRNIDYVVLTGRQDNKTVERIWDQYEHLFCGSLTFAQFKKVIDEFTQGWKRVILDVSIETRQGVRPAEMFWCRGVDPRVFSLQQKQ